MGALPLFNSYWVTGIAILVGKCVIFLSFLFFFLSFSVSGKVFPITPLLSGVFVRRVFCGYFGRISGGSRKAYISLVDKVEYFINLKWRRRLKRKWRYGGSLNKMYPYGAKEWNVNCINKTGGENKYLKS